MSLTLSVVAVCCSLSANAYGQTTAPQSTVAQIKPSDYALLLPISVQGQGNLHRFALPVALAPYVQQTQFKDVAVFNAQGQIMPLALVNPSTAQNAHTVQQQRYQLKLYPLSTPAGQLNAKRGVVRIENNAQGTVVDIQSSSRSQVAQTTGHVLDIRSITQALHTLKLTAALPNAQVTHFHLEHSSDLAQWQTAARTVAYPFEGQANSTVNFELNGISLTQAFLRLSWVNDQGQPSQARVMSAELTTQKHTPVSTVGLLRLNVKQIDSHTLEVNLPASGAVHSLQFDLPTAGALIPLRIYAGNLTHQQTPRLNLRSKTSSQPRPEPEWQLIADTVIYDFKQGQTAQKNTTVALPSITSTRLRIQASAQSQGFANAAGGLPVVQANIDMPQAVFLSMGQAPYTLALGASRQDLAQALPIATLMPAYQAGAEQQLPQAKLELQALSGQAPPAVTVQTQAANSAQQRRWVLWGVLIAGFVLLVALSWVLVKKLKVSDTAHS